MKINLLKISIAFLISGVFQLTSACSPQKNNFDWLVGQWVRVNDSEDQTTYEFWEKRSETEYKGLGFTMQQSDTIWKEHIYLRERNGNWGFEVHGMKDIESTIFKLTNVKQDKFVVENKENEFPKKIEYHLLNNHIHAVISGGGPEILFEFKKLKP